jgi:CheY-like chemotaxis protein/two-component sensor histidine kinase
MLEVLKRAEAGSDTLTRARETMARQLGQLVRLVDDLLDLNRITHNRLELRRSVIELAPVIRQAVEASKPLADREGHRLEVAIPEGPIYVNADPARLAQVVDNLLNNACKYTPPGGRISVRVRVDGPRVVVAVRDNGIGIPADKQDSIFDMFMQIDPATARAHEGLGIGLTLVKRLVEMHGGTVDVRSGGDVQGSEFVVALPVACAPASVPAAERPVPASPRRRILVVDDNRDSAVSLAMLLEFEGHATFTAHDGEAALEAAARHRPDVALLDIGLPGLDGHEVCRRIRAEPWGRDMILIALTGWGQDDDRLRSQQAGFHSHLVKPVDPRVLADLLDTLPIPSGRLNAS